LDFAVSSSRAVKLALLAAVIVVTVATKILITYRGGEPATADLRDAVVKILNDGGYQTTTSYLYGFIVDAQRLVCRLRVLQTQSEGYNLDAIANMARGAQLHFAYDGELLDHYPTLRVVFSGLWNRMKSRGGFASDWSPPLSIVTAPGCRIEDVPWKALADIRNALR
jgi:hypothetical protein